MPAFPDRREKGPRIEFGLTFCALGSLDQMGDWKYFYASLNYRAHDDYVVIIIAHNGRFPIFRSILKLACMVSANVHLGL
jgi:hypothetical protein